MKKQTLKTLFFALLIGVSGMANAGVAPKAGPKKEAKVASRTLDVNIYPRKNGLVAVNFSKNENETVRVSIYNTFGERIFTERIKSHEVVAKKYDISKLPANTYYFEVSNANYLVRQVINK